MYKPIGADFMIIPQKVLEKINNIYFLQTKKRKRISYLVLLTITAYLCYYRPPYTEYIAPFIFIIFIFCYHYYFIITLFLYAFLQALMK